MRVKDKKVKLDETIDKFFEKDKNKKESSITLVNNLFYDKVSQGGLTWYLR